MLISGSVIAGFEVIFLFVNKICVPWNSYDDKFSERFRSARKYIFWTLLVCDFVIAACLKSFFLFVNNICVYSNCFCGKFRELLRCKERYFGPH